MCGIIGYISLRDETAKIDKERFLHDALIIDSFRGMDSTGLITVCEDFKVSTHKEVLPGYYFIDTEEMQAMPRGWAAIGHNRAATKGAVNVKNAHPFTYGPVSLVHNGTLNNLGINLPNACKKVDVDSYNIARALGNVAVEDAHKVLSDIRGAYALVWTDTRDKSVNIAKNGQRPLHWSFNQAKTIMWFMSSHKHMALIKDQTWCTTTGS